MIQKEVSASSERTRRCGPSIGSSTSASCSPSMLVSQGFGWSNPPIPSSGKRPPDVREADPNDPTAPAHFQLSRLTQMKSFTLVDS